MRFITDMGESLVCSNTATGETFALGRYGVWDNAGRRKPEVVSTGNDLDELQRQYGPNLKVVVLRTGNSRVGTA